MKSKFFILFIIIFSILFIEIVSYFAVKSIFKLNKNQLLNLKYIWFSKTILLYLILILGRSLENNMFKNIYFNGFMMIFILKLFISVVFFVIITIQFFSEKLFSSNFSVNHSDFISSRRSFAGKLTLGLATIPFTGLLYGIFKTAYDYKIHKVKISSKKIPSNFSGFKIVQISDIHTGSLQGIFQLEKAINIINEIKADVIFFTGDLVNNRTNEANDYFSILSKLKAPLGVFSVLGNHDYGDYNSWNSPHDKNENFNEMLEFHQKLGWNLLMNENILLQKEKSYITLIGVENWGGNLNFKKYGDLNKAVNGIDETSFQILLSHDPSHWSHQVISKFQNIDLTLSGHTHGFQFGIEIPGFKWSPSKYIYPHWAGLYKANEQYLYVNRGLGCLGYMGRIGIKPEITLIELSNC